MGLLRAAVSCGLPGSSLGLVCIPGKAKSVAVGVAGKMSESVMEKGQVHQSSGVTLGESLCHCVPSTPSVTGGNADSTHSSHWKETVC